MDINYLDIIDSFHFIRPWFLAAILPLLVMIYFLRKQVRSQSGWQGVLAGHLYDNLVSIEAGKQSSPPWLLLFAGWLLTCLALAGPTWEKLPQPVYQVSKGKVILMDMSMSMRAEDIKPNRLSRVRFKAMDLLDALQEGETGMVAYAGDAFVISPLTSDVQNIEALVPSLTPEIMPSQGSDAVFALETTFELLKNAGYKEGDVFWLTDGIDLSEVAPLRNLLSNHDYRINILAVGTEDGAPIKIANGNFLKNRSGAVVIPKLRTSALSTIARSTGGRFVISRPDDADITYLAEARLEPEESAKEQGSQDDSFGDQWKEFGPWILLLLLPVAAYGFRRGVLPVFLVLILTDSQTQVYAQEDIPNGQNVATQPAPDNWWNNLWQTPNQQGAKSFEQQDFDSAAQQFEDPLWKGVSHFNAGDFEKAAETYSTMDTPDGNFGLGNALAQNQQYPEAIAAYERALELDPDYPNAAENKQYLEDLMEQQQQDQQQQDQNQDGEQDEEQEDGSDQEQQDQNSEQQQDSQQNQDQQQDSESQQQDSQQEQSEQEQQESDQQQGQEQEEQEGQQSEEQESEEEQSEQEMQEQQAQMQEPELTDEQKEQLQKIENWLRKVPDDPAYLLKRKMLLEQQRRQRQRVPATEQKNW